MSETNIKMKADALRKLEALAKENYRQGSTKGTKISFQSALFWNLLSPKPVFKTNDINELDLRNEGKSEISLKNHFVLPLHDGLGSERGNTAVNLDFNPFPFTPGELKLFGADTYEELN